MVTITCVKYHNIITNIVCGDHNLLCADLDYNLEKTLIALDLDMKLWLTYMINQLIYLDIQTLLYVMTLHVHKMYLVSVFSIRLNV